MSQVLVVEDDPDALALITSILDAYGHEALGCESPTEAIAAIGNGYVPDAICLDADMPEMDDFHLWYRLKRHPRLADHELPTIFVSERTDLDRSIEGEALGGVCVAKPFSSTHLHRALAIATSRARFAEAPQVRI